MPVKPWLPPTIAVYAPGGRVATIADSKSNPGARPLASSSAAQTGLSRQLSLLAISELSEALSCKVGSERAVLKKPAACNEGPNPRMATLLGELPVIMKPPMATFSPASTCKRVEIFKAWTATAATGVGVGVGVACGV